MSFCNALNIVAVNDKDHSYKTKVCNMETLRHVTDLEEISIK